MQDLQTFSLRAAQFSILMGFVVMGAAHAEIKILKVTNAADYTNSTGIQFETPANGGLAAVYCTGLSGSGTIPAIGYPIPIELAGVSIDVFGVPAPILGIVFNPDFQQILIQVPWETVLVRVSGVYVDWIEVRQNGQYDRTKIQSGLGMGRLFSDANGFGIAQHGSDYSPITASSPAHAGEWVIVYATGLGPVDMPPETGYPPFPKPALRVLSPVDVVLAGTATQVLFEGLSPGLVGINQINFQVPTTAPAGNLDLKLSTTLTACFPFGICHNGQTPETVTANKPDRDDSGEMKFSAPGMIRTCDLHGELGVSVSHDDIRPRGYLQASCGHARGHQTGHKIHNIATSDMIIIQLHWITLWPLKRTSKRT